MNFPQYRKYRNGQSYFKIVSETEIIELKMFGSFYEIHHIKATILPERVMITDLLNQYETFAKTVSENEFEEKLRYCEVNLKLLNF